MFCDAGQIQQVMLVLMVNAAEAMPEGGRLAVADRVRARRRAASLAGPRHRLRHSGGVAAADFRTVLHHQRRPASHRPRAGDRAAALWSSTAGEITVNSEPGRGTEFVMTLPYAGRPSLNGEGRRDGAAGPRRAGEELTECSAQVNAVKNQGRILIVDDDLVVRDSLGKWFESEGYTARPVASGREALENMQQADGTSRCSISKCPAWMVWSCTRKCARSIRN